MRKSTVEGFDAQSALLEVADRIGRAKALFDVIAERSEHDDTIRQLAEVGFEISERTVRLALEFSDAVDGIVNLEPRPSTA
ncbi:hypothetical protein KDX25_34530 [Burkholderia cenocepacia]|uniref:hypothetical protein n=1 Tax=Burkholderia cenocepacia TaxID=95486 RepID=UPI001B99D1CE|nr:hypothetical protein [Burkholderia cenocepacia]MBR8311531.1 hypothetical protein [Burkholderia cenocepacia]